MRTSNLLREFANQKPGLCFADYGNRKIYFSEMREITKDLHDFRELFSFAISRIENFDNKLTEKLSTNSDRLSLKNGKLEYITGQYFPTEYRPACNRILVSLIWDDYRNEKDAQGKPVYETGTEIRKAIRRNFSRRVCRNYFN